VEDRFGRAFRAFDDRALEGMLWYPKAGVGLTCLDQYQDSGVQWVWGWNAVHRLPKARDLALRAGSCGVFEVTDQAAAQVALETLLTRGGGFRTTEGFGQVALMDREFCDQGGDDAGS
jgi:hypothetical protein